MCAVLARPSFQYNKANTTITELSLRNNVIEDDSACTLSQALMATFAMCFPLARTKCILVRVLLAMIGAVLRSQQLSPTHLRHGDVIIDARGVDARGAASVCCSVSRGEHHPDVTCGSRV